MQEVTLPTEEGTVSKVYNEDMLQDMGTQIAMFEDFNLAMNYHITHLNMRNI